MIVLTPSTRKHKKWMATVPPGRYGRTSVRAPVTVHFGDSRYSDFTRHRDVARKARYVTRHRTRENWKKGGVTSPGFWARWVLWNKPTIRGSVRDVNSRFKLQAKVRY